jgi:hypothetical protein
MSKLADLLRRATRAEPAPIGFAAGARKTPPSMLVVALIGESWARGAGEAAAAGADALLLTGEPPEKELADALSKADGRPCGLLAPAADAGQTSQLRTAGIDFLVLEPQGPSTPLQDEGMTFLLRVRDEFTDIQLRTLDTLPLAALYLETGPPAFTILGQMELKRISGLARKPLLVPVQADVEQHDLFALRDAGVGMVAVDAVERGGLDLIRRLLPAIAALPHRRRPRSDDGTAVSLAGAVGGTEEEEEEEEED